MDNFASVPAGNVRETTASSNTPLAVPESEYNHRLNEWRRKLTNLRALHHRLWTYLIIVVTGGIAITLATFSFPSISKLWLVLPFVLAASSLQSLARNARSYGRAQRIVNFYHLGIARLRHQWQGRGMSGEEFRPDRHPYASDLDLFGPGSLFELLCTARTGVGRARLADWLLRPARCGEVRERQIAVNELRDMLDLREEWASIGGNALDQVSASAVGDWARARRVGFRRYARSLAITLPICLIALSMFAYVGIFGHHWLWAIALPLGLEALLAAVCLKHTRLTVADLVLPSFELALLVPLLARLEIEQFRSPLLKALQSRLVDSSARPSKQIRTLRVLVWLMDLRRFEYFALLVAPVLWGTNLAILIEQWRQSNQGRLVTWLESLGQFEALFCLARYSYENPDHAFATLKPQSPPLFQAEALGHPLLDRETCVRCDLSLDSHETQLMVVSGSNMSGKSTLLRAVGLNSVLAFAGAPVCAARLLLSPFEIGCSIAVQDSLLQAKSRFQVEVERLKWILDLARSGNLLFLLDEVLGGTNSKDRLWGARAVIEHLMASRAVGIVTTHDLALTEIVEALDSRAINVHFEDYYEKGEMRFDYRMRSGVLTRTNGLNVMAALGLLPSSMTSGADVATPGPRAALD